MSVIYGQMKIETIPAVIYMRHVLLAKLRERDPVDKLFHIKMMYGTKKRPASLIIYLLIARSAHNVKTTLLNWMSAG
jgi:hypothetical protein